MSATNGRERRLDGARCPGGDVSICAVDLAHVRETIRFQHRLNQPTSVRRRSPANDSPSCSASGSAYGPANAVPPKSAPGWGSHHDVGCQQMLTHWPRQLMLTA